MKLCSEPDKAHSYKTLKLHTLDPLKTVSLKVKSVTRANMLHNLKSNNIICDEVCKHFRRGREKQKWYYRNHVKILCSRVNDKVTILLYRHLKEEVDNLSGRK